MKSFYVFVRLAGTFAGGVVAYWFFSGPVFGPRLPFSDVETLSAEEIGQELGGN